MNTKPLVILKVIAALATILLAIIRIYVASNIASRMDPLFFIVVGISLAALVLPIERARALKAAGMELSLDLPQVEGAIEALGLGVVESQELRNQLLLDSETLRRVRGSRLLWIDDFPLKLVGERRLLRSLGVHVRQVTSSAEAESVLRVDNDFDLLLTDVQRQGETYKVTGGNQIHEGVNFVVFLRKNWEDPVVSNIPAVFYAAYDRSRLVEFTRPARELQPEAEISNSPLELFSKLLPRLAAVRLRPITTPAEKEPT